MTAEPDQDAPSARHFVDVLELRRNNASQTQIQMPHSTRITHRGAHGGGRPIEKQLIIPTLLCHFLDAY
jgi:hypothetical protein